MISIIVPIYIQDRDVLEFTKECLETLEVGLEGKDEIIVVDDCSPLKHDIKCGVKHSQNLGIAGAWNNGIRKAKNELILLSNSDVLAVKWRDMLKDIKDWDILFPRIHNMANNRLEERLAGEFFVFRKSLLNEIGWFNENFGMYYEDTDFFMRALKAGKKLGICPNTFVIHQSKGTVNKVWNLQEQNEIVRKSGELYHKIHKNNLPRLSNEWQGLNG